MGVARHLGIRTAAYDRAIRQFIPGYAPMLAAAAEAAAGAGGRLVDLGMGTGALAAACLRRGRPESVCGIDADPALEPAARRRLGPRLEWITANFERCALPPADAIVSALALHHVRSERAKLRLYRRCRMALRNAGVLVNADCCPARSPELAAAQFAAWRAHLRRYFSARAVEGYLARWACEDHYLPLETEMDLLRRAGFAPEVVWRLGAFAVIAARVCC